MMACTPSSDSCISNDGVGRKEFPPAEATKSPIMLMSGFRALAAEPPAPPRLTGLEEMLSAGAGACSATGGVAADGADATAGDDAGGGAACAFIVRIWP